MSRQRRGAGPRPRNAGARRLVGTRLQSAKGRTTSSARWLRRQLKDPYVIDARRAGYRSRAAFKLIELDDRFHLFKPGMTVLDLGAAPGGWTQVAVERVAGGRVVGVEIGEMDPIAGATMLRHDVLSEDAAVAIAAALGGPAEVVLSDMATPATGHGPTDHIRVVALAEAAFAIARAVLAPGGALVAKVLRGGAERPLLEALRRDFAAVRHVKPPASRKESRELYVVATGFRGDSGDE